MKYTCPAILAIIMIGQTTWLNATVPSQKGILLVPTLIELQANGKTIGSTTLPEGREVDIIQSIEDSHKIEIKGIGSTWVKASDLKLQAVKPEGEKPVTVEVKPSTNTSYTDVLNTKPSQADVESEMVPPSNQSSAEAVESPKGTIDETKETIQETEELIIATITPEGGRVEPQNPNTKFKGLSLYFPPNAVDKDTKIKVSMLPRKERGEELPGKSSGVFAKVEAEGLEEFINPIRVEITYKATNPPRKSPAAYHIIDGTLHRADATKFRPDLGVIHFEMFSPGSFTWTYVPLIRAY